MSKLKRLRINQRFCYTSGNQTTGCCIRHAGKPNELEGSENGKTRKREDEIGVGKEGWLIRFSIIGTLDVYQLSVEAAMEIYELSKAFPTEEVYSLTNQIRRASRSISGQIAEGWKRRKYEACSLIK